MKVLILAAGRGTRISRYLSGKPKCTVDIGGGQCLIEYTIDLLHSRGIQDIGIVLGYEAQVIREALMNGLVKRFPEAKIVLTLGGDGSVYRDGDTVLRQGIYKVPVVDTTAAGDTFTGYFIGGLQLGEDPKTALEHAAKAAAIAVSRPGAAPSVPNREEVETFEG